MNTAKLQLGLYYTNGNIASKSGAGNYAYSSNKPHAVTGITNDIGSIHNMSQQITYNPFQKTATISEATDSYTITYGTDRQRKKTVLKASNTITETKVYSGLYEKLTDNKVYFQKTTCLGVVLNFIKLN